jgi:hypothetical protein
LQQASASILVDDGRFNRVQKRVVILDDQHRADNTARPQAGTAQRPCLSLQGVEARINAAIARLDARILSRQASVPEKFRIVPSDRKTAGILRRPPGASRPESEPKSTGHGPKAGSPDARKRPLPQGAPAAIAEDSLIGGQSAARDATVDGNKAPAGPAATATSPRLVAAVKSNATSAPARASTPPPSPPQQPFLLQAQPAPLQHAAETGTLAIGVRRMAGTAGRPAPGRPGAPLRAAPAAWDDLRGCDSCEAGDSDGVLMPLDRGGAFRPAATMRLLVKT